uniref:NAD(P)-dependent oxidoreductase n=1 Tax=Ignisphaera aggregans TaxID=334771 RepID=A0A7C2ZPK5_9CREN
MVNVAVTGGGGFIGRFLVGRLVEKGYTVLSLDLSPSPFKPNPRIIHHRVDITHTLALNKLLAKYKPEAVVHLAALLADACEQDPVRAFKVNLEATQNLIELSITHGVNRFVFISSAGVYNPNTPEPVIEEYGGRPVLSYYGVTKYVGELIGLWYASKGLIDFRALRPTVVFGPGRFRGPSAEYSSLIIEKALKGEKVVIKNPDDRVNYIYVKDTAEALLTLLEAPQAPSRVYNAAGFVCKVIEFVELVKKFIPTLQYEIVPQPAVRYPAVVDDSKIRNELGWSPKYLYEKAIEDYIETATKGHPLFDIY